MFFSLVRDAAGVLREMLQIRKSCDWLISVSNGRHLLLSPLAPIVPTVTDGLCVEAEGPQNKPQLSFSFFIPSLLAFSHPPLSSLLPTRPLHLVSPSSFSLPPSPSIFSNSFLVDVLSGGSCARCKLNFIPSFYQTRKSTARVHAYIHL